MARRVTKSNFERFGFGNEGDNRDNPPVSDEIQQTLTRLLAWNDNKEQWELTLADSDGRLLVSSAPTKADENNSSNPTPNTSSTSVVGANDDRKQVIISNVGSVDVYLAFGEAATLTNGFLLEAGATYIDDVWLGAINGITSSGTASLTVNEME